MSSRPDYGIDAPGVLAMFFVLGALCEVLGLYSRPFTVGQLTVDPSFAPQITGAIFLAEGVLMWIYIKWGKLRHRDRMLAQVQWTGNECVLDVGTGRGLLLIGAAKRLTTGHAVGIDIWSAKDMSGNSEARTEMNVEVEGVKDKVELLSQDATAMPFADHTFDVVLSNLCIHNIPGAAGRAQACREIARVLRPGGQAVISDYRLTRTYAKVFAAEGFTVEWRGPFWGDTFPPLKMFVARKPL